MLECAYADLLCSFLVLFISYFAVLQGTDSSCSAKNRVTQQLLERQGLHLGAPITGAEIWFIVYAAGITLDKVASILEHGWTGELVSRIPADVSYSRGRSVFTANMWNGLDASFSLCFLVYAGLLAGGRSELAHTVLACGAILLFPRYASDDHRVPYSYSLQTGLCGSFKQCSSAVGNLRFKGAKC